MSSTYRSFGFKVEGVVENYSGTTTVKNFTTTTLDNADRPTFDARAFPDDTNDALMIQVQDSGSNGDQVRWVCNLTTAEVTY